MAGGMSPGRGPTLAARSVAAGIGELEQGADPASLTARTAPPTHPHVWVRDVDPTIPPRPAVVIEQAQDASGAWLIHVAMVIRDDDGSAVTMLGWVSAERVTRA